MISVKRNGDEKALINTQQNFRKVNKENIVRIGVSQ